MAKFKVIVTRRDEYEIEVDEKIWNDVTLREWSKHFHEAENVEDVAKAVGFSTMRFGKNSFFEGFGHIKTLNNDKTVSHAYDSMRQLKDEEYCKGLKMRIVSEDEDYDYEIDEMKS